VASEREGVDVLVGHALFPALDPKQAERRRPYPPLGSLYVAAVLRRAGWRVALFDAMLAEDEGAFVASLERHQPRLVALVEDSFNYLSKMCLGRMRQAALTMTTAGARQGLPVLVSGSDATDDPAAFLGAGAVAVVLGEPEHAVAEATAVLLGRAGGEDLTAVAGLALAGRGADAVRRTPPREPERRPDGFPWPARDLLDVDAYRSVWQEAHGLFSTNMASTRGCPFHCNWCAKPIWGQRYAMRSPEDVAAELAEVKRTLAPDHVWFADDIFGLRPDWTAAFGEAVAARSAQLPFQIQSRVDLMQPAALAGLARAGCAEVWLGVESGSQAVLDAMQKGIRVADVAPAAERLRAHGIRVGFFLQLGYPGEEWPDILATRDLVRACLPDEIGVSVSYPLPGTPFYDRVADQLGPRRHWHDSRDLAMLFVGRYATPFYRRLHDVLHRDLDARLGRADGDPAAAVRAVEAEWQALALDEPQARQADATWLPRSPVVPAAPDLSRAAN
jgi:anaerobic magnesium-protoporphyrin IX monomethyl ester cyclase